MLTLALAVVVASLVGSLHCVGMCGPFALWATHGGSNRVTIAAYHLGRLTTYMSAGLAAGVLGTAVTIGGDLAGYQLMAAKVAGGLLIFLGISRLLLMLSWFQPAASRTLVQDSQKASRTLVQDSQEAPAAFAKPSGVVALLQKAKPLVAGRGPGARAYLTGLLTTWLPCGWLYLFVLIAAGTGDVFLALAVMAAFWIGTVPALTALMLGARSLIPRFPAALPIAAAVLLIVTGLYTATGRASADLSTMIPPELERHGGVTSLIGLTDESLPCCEP